MKVENSEKRHAVKRWSAIAWVALMSGASGLVSVHCGAQNAAALPFEVSNPKGLKWSAEEAARIYKQACAVVARSLRPDRPPLLQPAFVLVLGARENQVVRIDRNSELRLKKWDPEGFAEGTVILSAH